MPVSLFSTAPNVYKIPTVLGSSKEGPIRSAPAYTMAGREKDSLIPTLVLPGPGYYDGEYTAVKPKPPVYTMRGKYKMVTDDNKPGPGAHCPEKVGISFLIYAHFSTYQALSHSIGRNVRLHRYLLGLYIPRSVGNRVSIYCLNVIRVACWNSDQIRVILKYCTALSIS